MSCRWWPICYLLFFCHGAEGQLQWVVKEKVTDYGQNLTLFCPVQNCCSEAAGWSVGHKAIIIDVKTFSNDPNMKYNGTYNTDGFGVVIRNLSEGDLNVTYHCTYGFYESTPKYLFHGDVFRESTDEEMEDMYNTDNQAENEQDVPDKEKENDTTATIIVVPIVVILVLVGIGIVAYCVYRSRTDEEMIHLTDSENQQERPSVHITSTNTDVVEGQSHTITCSISTISDITDITWIKTSATGDKIYIVVGEDGKFSGGALSNPSLTINNIAKSDEGTYACIVKHSFGTTSSEDSVLTCKEPKNIQTKEALNEELWDAAETGNTDLVQSCLLKGADVNNKGFGGRTLLHLAAESCNSQIVYLLLKSGASPSVVDNEDQTPLHRAAKRGITKIVFPLLMLGASPSVVDKQDQTPLHIAAEFGRPEVVDHLLKSGASLSVVDKQGRTPLHRAAEEGRTDVVVLLLMLGASPSVVDKQGKTPLQRAEDGCRTKIKYLLSKSGAFPSALDSQGRTPLHWAAATDNTEKVYLLLKSGACPSILDNQGKTPLHIAAEWGRSEVVQLLSMLGASPFVVDKQGKTPLHIAAEWGRSQVVYLLLMLGASPSLVDKQGQTALHIAAEFGRPEVVDLLLKSEDSLSVVDKHGQRALHRAAAWGRTEVVNLLLKSGALPSVVDNQGQTALHIAAEFGRPEVVDLLLKTGASLSAVDKQGQTALHIAAAWGRTEVVNLLLKSGSPPSVVDNQKYAASRADLVLQFPMMGMADEMRELISKGTFMAFENRVYLVGTCNVGRSTLARILLGEEIPQSWKSNERQIIYVGRNGIHLNDKTMVPLKKGFYGDVLSKILPGQPEMKQEKHPSRYGKSLPEIEKKMRLPHATEKELTSQEHPAAESKANLSEKTETALVKGTRHKDTHKGLSKPQSQTQKMSKQSYITIHDEIKEELRKGNYKVNIAPSDLVDFGGQTLFDMTRQLFIQHKGEYILMFNGRFDLFDPLPEYPQGDVTTASILKHWVSSILSYCADDDDILPIILFAATHSDGYRQKDRINRRKRLIKDLKEMFQNHEQHKRIMYDDIFFIIGKDEHDAEINRLKTKLVEVAFKQKSWGKRMPMAWAPLDLQFSEMRLHNTTIISREDLTALNRSNEDLALTDTQIEHFLKVQHSLGKILYFDQHGLEKFIIVQPQSLVNILRSFITDEQFWPEDESLRDILRTMINTGEIPKKGLLKLWSQKEFDQDMPSNDLKEFIMQVLVHLDILVEPKQYNQKQKSIVQSYLVPCIVKRELPFTDVYYKSRDDKMIFLSYTLLKSSIPAALSFKLIGAAMNVWPLKETPEGVCLYHQAAILCIDRANELHISVKDNKIIIYLINEDTKRFIPPNIASTVQECLTMTMKNVLEFYHKSFGKSLSTSEVSNLFEIEVGEWCDTGACYISVPEVKTMLEWRCKNKKIHKFPLFWIFDKTQSTCGERCTGLDTKYLTLCPNDQHLVRLAGLVPCGKCNELVIHLGLSNVSWNHILEQYGGYGPKVVNFVALSDWRKLKTKQMKLASFKDLSDALTEVNYNQHVLCQVFKEDVDVFDIDNIALQQIPEDDELKELSRQVGNCAIQLGVELGLSMAIIEHTLFKYQKDIFEQSFDVLQNWKTSCKVKPTIRMLMKAIQACDPRGLKFLKDKYA